MQVDDSEDHQISYLLPLPWLRYADILENKTWTL
jgi:hypothetical protein